jgi:hypothetical protein
MEQHVAALHPYFMSAGGKAINLLGFQFMEQREVAQKSLCLDGNAKQYRVSRCFEMPYAIDALCPLPATQ